jgi:hypothetical protein
MADFVEYKNNKGETTITLDGENATVVVQTPNNEDRYFSMDGFNGSMTGIGTLQLTNPSDGSEVLIDAGTVQLRGEQDNSISVSNTKTGAFVAMGTSRGLIVRDRNGQEVVDLSIEGVVKVLDNSGHVRFEYSLGNLTLRNSAGEVTFSIDSETGDVRHKGTFSQL